MTSAVAAVVVDNGEPTLERCLVSLRSQSVRPLILVAPGPQTNMEVASKYADRVLPPADGIGRARVQAVLEADADYIVSCDSDTVYDGRYVEYALQSLQLFPVVKAGIILPLDSGGGDPLAWAESFFSPLIPYEFALAFRKKVFVDAGLDREDYSNPRADIGVHLARRMFFVLNDPRMTCWTRLPTKGAVLFKENYLLSALGAMVPVATLGGVIGFSLLS